MDEGQTSVKRAIRKSMVSSSGRQVAIEEDEAGRLTIEVAGAMGVTMVEVAHGKTVIELYVPKH